MKNRVQFLVVAVCCLPATALAYIDPGSGMLLWQGLIAAIGALLVFMRSPLQTIKNLIRRLSRK
jgi:hypothetical protein